MAEPQSRPKPSPRANVVQFVIDMWGAVRNGEYKFVKRGAVNWAGFPFDKYAKAVSINIDDCGLFPRQAGCGTTPLTMSFEIMAKLKPENPDADKAIDDGLMDQFYADAQCVLLELLQAKDETGNPLVVRFVEGSDTAVETSDANMGVQGLVILFKLDF